MSARKYPIYSMAVGDSFVVDQPPKCLRTNLRLRARARGIRLSIRRNPTGIVVTRVE